nr:hypothetical protein [uncultured Duganella sp.]
MAALPDMEIIDAKLEAVESRMDGRIARIESALAASASLVDERLRHTDAKMDERSRQSDARMDRIETALSELRFETRSSISGLKTTIIVTAVTAVLAIVFGVAAFNATLLSNMLAAFESGKQTAATQAEVKRQVEATAVLLNKMEQRVDAPPKPHSTPKQ